MTITASIEAVFFILPVYLMPEGAMLTIWPTRSRHALRQEA
ncbi:hypothetical protein SeJ_A1680 [Salmonella enterica subsp. enterica serovar Javiana str. GA_MM04042433]|nr:hypothetical protein SeJ_A1680 [Salmonella enterica subsp. enterica serovar Javiana str. GA_MM04042433]